MGYGVGYVCKKCKKEKEMLYGVGFLDSLNYYEENNFKNLIVRGIKENIQNLDKLKDFVNMKDVHLSNNYGNDAYICINCKNIDNKFKYMLTLNNKRFIPKYKCNYCNDVLRLKKETEDFNIICDNCGSTDFEKDIIYMDWD